MRRTFSMCCLNRAAVITVLLVLLGLGFLWPAVQDAKEAARRSQCHGNLFSLGCALRNFYEVEGSFPPANIAAPDGTPLSSWRVLVVPYCGKDLFSLQYDLNLPWNDKLNYHFAQQGDFMFLFACPSGPNYDHTRSAEFYASRPRLTNYVGIAGPGTIFPGGDKTISKSDITDGAKNTLLLVEIANSDIHWAEPRDLQVDEMSFQINDPTRPSISTPHEYGPGVIFADGQYFRLPRTIDPEIVKALITIDGGEKVARDELIRQGILQ